VSGFQAQEIFQKIFFHPRKICHIKNFKRENFLERFFQTGKFPGAKNFKRKSFLEIYFSVGKISGRENFYLQKIPGNEIAKSDNEGTLPKGSQGRVNRMIALLRDACIIHPSILFQGAR